LRGESGSENREDILESMFKYIQLYHVLKMFRSP
jgi:hypothetical protein